MNEIILQNKDGKILASSRDVAEKFGKNHKEILRSIAIFLKELVQRNFALYSNLVIIRLLTEKQIKNI